MACNLLLIAAVDVPYQIWDNRQKLLMTKQEVREYKDSEEQARGQVEDPPDAARDGAEETDDGGGAGGDELDADEQPDPLAVALKYDPAMAAGRRCCWPQATISWP